jgi:hypothetical protein
MSIKGYKYVIIANGGYSMTQTFPEIEYIGTNGTDLTRLYDLTHTLQLAYDVRIINEKLGIYKDASNNYIIDDTDTRIKDDTLDDYVVLTVDDFLDNINASQVISLGKYSSLYKEFTRKTNTYFGYADGFPKIFDANGASSIGSGDLSANDIINLLTDKHLDASGNLVYKLNGVINIYQLTNILNFVVENNPFHNRDNKTRRDGFIAGDRLLIETGITISLDLTTFNASYISSPVYNNNLPFLQYSINAPLLLTLQNLS